MTAEQLEFGLQLRRERERRKISLSSVAESTKIGKSLLSSLEGGDASQWPNGIYRRAFLREYAAAVGLPPEPIVAEFQRLFPEAGRSAQNRQTILHSSNELRLTLEPERHWSGQPSMRHAAAAVLDGLAVLPAAVAASMLLQLNVWAVTALLVLIYHSLATAWVGGSPALWIMNGRMPRGAAVSGTRSRPRPQSREILQLVSSTRQEGHPAAPDRAAPAFAENARSAS